METAGCHVEERDRRILAYNLGSLEPSERDAFEAHILTCDDCFEDVTALERAARFVNRLTVNPPAEVGRLVRRRRWLGFAVPAGLLLLFIACFYVLQRAPGTGTDRRSAGGRPVRMVAADVRLPGEDCAELLARADLEETFGRHESAVRYYEAAANQALVRGDPASLALSRAGASAVSYFRLLDATAGERSLALARDALEETAAPLAGFPLLRLQQQRALLVDGDYEAAVSLAEAMVERCRDLPPIDERRADALQQLGLAREALGLVSVAGPEALAPARAAYEEAMRIREVSDGLRGMAPLLSALGRLAIAAGAYEDAARDLGAALECPGMRTRSGGEALARANLALLLQCRGRLDSALEQAQAAEEQAERVADPFLRADTRGLVGLILVRLGREAEGRAALEEALKRGEGLYLTPSRRLRSAEWRRALSGGAPAGETRPIPLASGLY